MNGSCRRRRGSIVTAGREGARALLCRALCRGLSLGLVVRVAEIFLAFSASSCKITSTGRKSTAWCDARDDFAPATSYPY